MLNIIGCGGVCPIRDPFAAVVMCFYELSEVLHVSVAVGIEVKVVFVALFYLVKIIFYTLFGQISIIFEVETHVLSSIVVFDTKDFLDYVAYLLEILDAGLPLATLCQGRAFD